MTHTRVARTPSRFRQEGVRPLLTQTKGGDMSLKPQRLIANSIEALEARSNGGQER